MSSAKAGTAYRFGAAHKLQMAALKTLGPLARKVCTYLCKGIDCLEIKVVNV